MKLNEIDWATITSAQACRLLAPAQRAEQAAAARWDASDTNADWAAWKKAADLEEGLLVFVKCGERPE